MENEIKTVEIHGRKIDVQDGGRCWYHEHVAESGYKIKRREVGFGRKFKYGVAMFMYNGKRCRVSQHELVALAFIGERPAGMVIDHMDGDSRNNHSSNLRYVNHVQNCKAHCRKFGKTSRYRGVCFDKKNSKWIARGCDACGRQAHLGRFTDERDAARAFNEFASDPANGYLPEALNVIEEQPA